jgi:hypothetical protein
MNNLEKLGKLSEIIGKIYFNLLLIVLIISIIAIQMSKVDNSEGVDKIAIIIGSIVGFGIFFFILRLLFRPVYGLNNAINQRIYNQIKNTEFKKKWWLSLICATIVALLPVIPTFGISILIMVPQFILLTKSRIYESGNS